MKQKPLSYYTVLGVSPNASDQDISQAYRAMALRFHPDRNPTNRAFFEKRFRLINEAYATLKNREKRIMHDKRLNSGNDNTTKQSSWLVQIIEALQKPNGNSKQA